MSNMSYCRFQNTLGDLQDCFENLSDEDLSAEETRARKKMIRLCMDFVMEAVECDLIEESDVAEHMGFEYDEDDGFEVEY